MSGFANIKGRVYTVSTVKHLKTKIYVQQVDSPLYNKYECTTSGTWKAKSNSCSVANLISATTTKQSVPDSVFYADIQIICESLIVCCFFQNKNVFKRFLALSLSGYLLLKLKGRSVSWIRNRAQEVILLHNHSI